MTSWLEHDWQKQDDDDGYYTCATCAARSPTRRKPKREGCPGKRYTDEELAGMRLVTERKPNGGLSLLAEQDDGKCIPIMFILPYYAEAANLLEQLVAHVEGERDMLREAEEAESLLYSTNAR